MREQRIELTMDNADIDLVLPNRETISVQWRTENPIPTLDVILRDDRAATNWQGDEDPPRPLRRA